MVLLRKYYSTFTGVLDLLSKKQKQMAKKQITPTSESIRKAYIQEFLKRKADAEAFANFTETELATFIRKYDSANFSGIYECLDHNFYDRVRDKIAINRKWLLLMRKQD